MKKIHYINQELLNQVSQEAADSPRKRKNYNFHQYEENANRMLNAIEPDSYVRPHHHQHPPKPEAFLVLQGKGAVIIFNDEGQVLEVYSLDPQKAQWGVDIPAGWYHTILSLEAGSVFYEVKPGPYIPSTDKDFASWAPKEGTSEAKEYLDTLHQMVLTSIGAAT